MRRDDEHAAILGIVIVSFDPSRHERSGFSCRMGRLENFLRSTANRQQKVGFTQAFVAAVV